MKTLSNSTLQNREFAIPKVERKPPSNLAVNSFFSADQYLSSNSAPEFSNSSFKKSIGKGLGLIASPIKSGARKARKLGGIVKTGLLTAIHVAPTLGTLVAAGALARIEGLRPGKEKLSAVEWLQVRAPKQFNNTLESVAKLVGSSTLNSTGLSVGDLLEIEEHIYKSLAPERDTFGRKTPARFISQLATAPFRQPDAPHAAFVYLGEGRERESREVMDLWNGAMPPSDNPYNKDYDLHRVWEVLEEKAAEKKLPVFIDLDGDARTFTSTEYVSKEIMNSMVTRHNELGDGFQDAGLYYAWLSTRQESFYSELNPWLAQKKPQLGKTIDGIKSHLTPPWLGAKEGLGPWPSPRNAEKAFLTVEELAKESSRSHRKLANFADTLVALDQDILTATMTHWMKLLKESGGDNRSELFSPIAKAWVKLNVESKNVPHLATPEDAPTLKALEGPPPVETQHPYDRAIAVGELVDHTLKGLGLFERKSFMDILKQELSDQLDFIQDQDDYFASLLGEKYDGIDFAPVLANRLECEDEHLNRRLKQLKSLLHEDNGLSEKDRAELHRHHSVADWVVRSQVRYGDVQVGILGEAEAFREQPLAVSQFFDQRQAPSLVTRLGSGPNQVQELGDESSANTLKVSIFREGGGGKGMAYPTPTKALKAGLKSIRYQFDDGGGSSAGVIPSLLEAAGFNDQEMEEISARLDFKEFNSDAIPLLGGTDPKIGGVNHTGMFSAQKMYRELYGLVSEKLGIEGRPILFRDLPQRLSVTGTVINTDLPADDPLRKLIDGDKRFVMNPEDTPNFDVIGAVTASTAVPAYFNAPQMQVARQVEKDGVLETKIYRMQFVDGGLVDNFPVSAARQDEDQKTALVVVPAFYEAIDPESGQKVSLSTLNFDDTHLEVVNQKNAEFYEKMMPKLDKFMEKVAEEGYSRVVFAMNLTDLEEQTTPLIQGQSKADTERLLELAKEEELPHFSAREGRSFMKGTVNKPSAGKTLAGAAFNLFLDGRSGEDNEYRWHLRASHSIPGLSEEENILQVIRSVGASALSASREQKENRLFEKV